MSRTNGQWRLARRPVGNFQDGDFTWCEEPVPALGDGQVLVRIVYLSLDPTNRIWASQDSYLPAVKLGDVMRGGGIGVVEESKNGAFAPGDVVQGLLGWQQFYVSSGSDLQKLPKLPVPLDAWSGLLGAIGLTAYFGLLEIGQPKAGETVVVSTAAGAVGSLVGQIAKIKGCRVVGLTGSDEKCEWIVKDLGYDAAINYKKENVAEALRKHCPKGIDVYFDNVGGDILNEVLGQIALRARIVSCGMISGYNATTPPPGPSNIINLLVRRGRMEGFIVLDYLSRAEECFRELIPWWAAGKLKYRVDIADGLESAPKAVLRLFDGSNAGKLIVRVSPEPS
ncbi:MAG: NADP-dependent oxidoreductase [Bryobacteraceae bacterium]